MVFVNTRKRSRTHRLLLDENTDDCCITRHCYRVDLEDWRTFVVDGTNMAAEWKEPRLGSVGYCTVCVALTSCVPFVRFFRNDTLALEHSHEIYNSNARRRRLTSSQPTYYNLFRINPIEWKHTSLSTCHFCSRHQHEPLVWTISPPPWPTPIEPVVGECLACGQRIAHNVSGVASSISGSWRGAH